MPAIVHHFGRVEVRPLERQVLIDGRPAALGARAFEVLNVLIERRDRAVTKDELLDLVWTGVVVQENNLQVQASALRKLLGANATRRFRDAGIGSRSMKAMVRRRRSLNSPSPPWRIQRNSSGGMTA